MRAKKGVPNGNHDNYDNDHLHRKDGALTGVGGKGIQKRRHQRGVSGGLPSEEAASEDDDDDDGHHDAAVYLLSTYCRIKRRKSHLSLCARNLMMGQVR